ncbi:CHAT domain-containing protein [Synechococcus sp. MIT S9503]|uniref:CHAT domain-containing protein n=1 Tax=Synechococcus sp. MIT S9503 TaxID=3082547 RepID=UPI0039A45993
MKRLVLFPLVAFLAGMPVQADVATRSADGLGTRINGALGGRCSSGVCHIDGGTRSGSNRFHRLSEFDTRGAIQGVSIDSDGVRNLVLGVTALDGSFINKSVSFSSPAHLFLLSPGGIQLMPGASFQQIPHLTLSTAAQLRFAGGVFDVFNTPITDIAALGSDPLPGALGLLPGSLGEKRPWIRMDGVSIDVDEALLVDAPGGRIDVDNSRLSVSNPSGDAGSLTLTADLIKVGDGAELLATGSGNGGLVQVGGSWQNTDSGVRQATQTWMQQGSTVDASSTGSGDGGTIVIWSDLNNPSGGTIAQGSLLARGGSADGDGGRIETSGAYLLAEPAVVDVSAMKGSGGEWLLDPYNITIGNSTGTINQETDPNGGGPLFRSSSSGSSVSKNEIVNALGSSTDVRILTGTGDPSQGGNITWESGASADYSNSSGKLTLDAAGYIQLNSNITTGSGGLTLKAGTGFAEAADGITLNLSGPLEIATGDTTIGTAGFASPAFAATLIGDGNLIKNGTGRLILSGNSSSWTGNTVVESGALRVTGANALGSSTSPTSVQSAGTLEISGGINFAEPILLSRGKLLSLSGDNTITETLQLIGSSAVEVREDSLTLDPSSAQALIVDPGTTAFNSDLTYAGDGDLIVKGTLNLQDGQTTKTYGDFLQTGAGTARFQEAFFAERTEVTGGGVIWMDQEDEVDIEVNTFFLDNGSLLRRDANETVNGASLRLGSDGGGISVADGFTLVWDSQISGEGDFIKEGQGALRFPVSADISYTGNTLVKAGNLDVLSTSPAKATCSGNGTSNRCDDPDPDPDPDPEPLVETEATTDESLRTAVLADAVADVPVFPPSQYNELAAESDFGGSSNVQPQTNNSSLVVDLAGQGELDSAVNTPNPSVVAGAAQTLDPDQAADQLISTDQAAASRTAQALGLDQADQDQLPPTPTVEELQTLLEQVETRRFASSPAVLQVRFTEMRQLQPGSHDAFLDLTLISSQSPVQAKRVEVNRNSFAALLKALYRQLSRQEALAVDNPASPTRQLHALLLEPVKEILEEQGIETLLIAADQGLQAVPFAALNDGSDYFGNRYAFALTPSLALTPLAPAESRSQIQLAMGASTFDGLAPLPLVPQELERIESSSAADLYLNQAFTPKAFLERSADQRYSRVHVATHADFRPGGPSKSVLHTGIGPMSMAQFADLRRQRRDQPLDLVVLSACRTLLGDADSELGFAGLALQAGARSAIGTLWYVDDVVTSAFFVQFYRLLDQGLSKAQALQKTRQMFSSGMIRLEGDVVIGAAGQPLLNELNPSQRRRIETGVQNPFFWAGIELIGSPW